MKQMPPAPRPFVSLRLATAAGLAAVVVAVSSVMLPASSFAQTPAPVARTERLERRLQRELKVLEREQKVLTQAAKRADRFQARIEKAKAAGKDTSKLEAALAAFKADVVTAQSHSDKAKSILDAKVGFDANGKVVDVAQAMETVKAAATEERQFQRVMRNAVRTLVKAIREFRVANRAPTGR